MKAKEAVLSAEKLRRLYRYDPDEGTFTRLVASKSPHGQYGIGSIAGGRNVVGYTQIWVDGYCHLAHRLAWLWMTGSFPANQVDHINGVKSDNRWDNLRSASAELNRQNIGTLGGITDAAC